MSLGSNILGIWTFDNTLEDESIYNNSFNPSSSVSYGNFSIFDLFQNKLVARRGLTLDGNYLSAGNSFNFWSGGYYKIGIGFWLYSASALGQSRHVVTRQLTSNISPILSKATTTTTNPYTDFESIQEGEFIIVEVGVSKTENAIRLMLCGASNEVTHIIESEPYIPGLHSIFIEYHQGDASGLAKIDIDGRDGIIHVGPNFISPSSAPVVLNGPIFGHTEHKVYNEGSIIGDLLITNSSNITGTIPNFRPSVKFTRFGWRYVADSDFEDFAATFNAISYEQNSTVNTNQIYTNGSSIYVAQSNGDLLKGSQSIWDNEWDYENTNEVKYINKSAIGTVEWNKIFGLKLSNGASIRI